MSLKQYLIDEGNTFYNKENKMEFSKSEQYPWRVGPKAKYYGQHYIPIFTALGDIPIAWVVSTDANAQLISAAPELLECLIEELYHRGDQLKSLKAINKAEGKS